MTANRHGWWTGRMKGNILRISACYVLSRETSRRDIDGYANCPTEEISEMIKMQFRVCVEKMASGTEWRGWKRLVSPSAGLISLNEPSQSWFMILVRENSSMLYILTWLRTDVLATLLALLELHACKGSLFTNEHLSLSCTHAHTLCLHCTFSLQCSWHLWNCYSG